MLSSMNPSRPPRPFEWDSRKATLFTVTLASTGRVTLACQATGMSRKSAYALKARDPLFAVAWEQARLASSAKCKARRTCRPPAAMPRVTARLRAAPSSRSTSQMSQDEERLLAHLLRTRPWRSAIGPSAKRRKQ